MKKYTVGDEISFEKTVTNTDTAQFASGAVHPVYATFAIARDAEWTSRLFVLEMKKETEEGIGTVVEVAHYAPAFVGETVLFVAKIVRLEGNNVDCTFTATVGKRQVATGRTGQKIIDKEKLYQRFEAIANEK